MNLRISDEQHRDAKIRVIAEYKRDRHSARIKEAIERRDAYNAQVKNDLGIEFEFKYAGVREDTYKDHNGKDRIWIADEWTITANNGSFKLSYATGVGHRIYYIKNSIVRNADVVPPSAMDILYTIRIDSDVLAYTFNDWCDSFGYNPDSIKHNEIYRQCLDMVISFRSNFPNVDLSAYEPLDNF